MVDFKGEIKSKAESLIQRAQNLPNIVIEWQKPIEIDCSQIGFGLTDQNFEPLQKNKNNPGIYYFKLESNSCNSLIVGALEVFKKTKQRSCPKIDKKRSLETDTLYCGSKKTDLHGRLIQHLGRGHKDTFALQLSHWTQELKICLEFHYAWIDPKYSDLIELVESALAAKLNPLVGKIAS